MGKLSRDEAGESREVRTHLESPACILYWEDLQEKYHVPVSGLQSFCSVAQPYIMNPQPLL